MSTKHTRRFCWVCAVLLAVLAVAYGPPARADGTRIRNRVGIDFVVKRHGVAFVAKVLKVQHVRKSRRAYGRNVRYIAKWRMKVKPLRMLKGSLDGKKQKAFWITRSTPFKPGKWKELRDHYAATGKALSEAKRGDLLVLYAHSYFSGKERPVGEANRHTPELEDNVKAIVARHEQQRLVKLRKGRTCVDPATYNVGGKCLLPKDIAATVTCPAGATARSGGGPASHAFATCENAAKQKHGTYRYWWATGEPREHTTWVAGVLQGPIRYWREDGSPTHQGGYKAGKRHGVWVHFDKAGKERGRYTLDMNSGRAMSFWDDGRRSEYTLKDGRKFGPEGHFYANGALRWRGTRHDGKWWGRHVEYRRGGAVMRVTCYAKKGKQRWQVNNPEDALKQALTKPCKGPEVPAKPDGPSPSTD